MNELIEIIEYMGKSFGNFWWSLFVIGIFFTGFLVITLSVLMTAVKLCIKEYFTYRIIYQKELQNKE